MPTKFKGTKIPKIPICQTSEMVLMPEILDKRTEITVNDQKFDIEADDLEVIRELGEFCQDIWLQLTLNIFQHDQLNSFTLKE